MLWVMLLFLAVWIAASVFGCWAVFSRKQQTRAWQRVNAEVVPDSSEKLGFQIGYGIPFSVAFCLRDGRRVVRTLKHFGESMPPSPGTRVEIIYDPDDPAEVEQYNGREKDFVAIFCGIGIILVGVAVCLDAIWKFAQR